MKDKLQRIINNENANSLIENVIVLPLIFIIIYFMLIASFIIHDRATLDAAAKRGSLYATKCINDPNYATILQKSGHISGELDTNVGNENLIKDSFIGVGNNIKPYRYLNMDATNIKNATISEVENIIRQTKIPWREIKTSDIEVKIENKIIYQNVQVDITAHYPLPQIFGNFGLPTDFAYTVSAQTAVNDPDEFIRNVDLIVDTCVQLDQKTGNNISNITNKIGDMADKLKEFLKIKN